MKINSKKVFCQSIFLVFIILFSNSVVSQNLNSADCNGSLRCTFIKAQVEKDFSVCEDLNGSLSKSCKGALSEFLGDVEEKNKFDNYSEISRFNYFYLALIMLFLVVILILFIYFRYKKSAYK
ncbi:hypothetical protein K9L67_00520 [Candidatus Woesearchaeota archaeon]|nr:hypothetical protein [Candidatus Woesearchaeota archaeon]MCF7900690.1 hypothetical protein [Candidatus Woesearchaeota archaeon]MCF8013211.1 hypothetical protein [Candidatus Woesearchaeota archaeon]